MAFIHVRHNVTQGEADISEESAVFYAALGWEPYEPPLPEEVEEIADEVSLAMTRPDLDALAAQAGVPNPEELTSKQAVLDAIADLATAIPASPDAEDQTQEN